ncbi:MAG: hypothetical protein IPI95_01930 [Flavobacteriales bacterium]|nr:hypothetical protein [Flavobacteriales bacterium]
MYNKATKAGALAYDGHGELVHDWTKGRTSSPATYRHWSCAASSAASKS